MAATEAQPVLVHIQPQEVQVARVRSIAVLKQVEQAVAVSIPGDREGTPPTPPAAAAAAGKAPAPAETEPMAELLQEAPAVAIWAAPEGPAPLRIVIVMAAMARDQAAAAPVALLPVVVVVAVVIKIVAALELPEPSLLPGRHLPADVPLLYASGPRQIPLVLYLRAVWDRAILISGMQMAVRQV